MTESSPAADQQGQRYPLSFTQEWFLTLDQGRHGPLAPLAGGRIGIHQRQFDILRRAGPRQQVELLEYEPDLLVPDLRQFVAIELCDADSVQLVTPRRRLVEAPENVHQGGFAGSGWPHDGDEIPALDLEGDAFQHVYGHLSQPVILHQILNLDYRQHAAHLESRSLAALAAALGDGAAAGSRSRLRHLRDNYAVSILQGARGDLRVRR